MADLGACSHNGTSIKAKGVDVTVGTYVGTAISVLLKIVLVVALLGFFGVQTTTFAALLAAVGIAIGAAWGGLLANFAAGTFLIIFRPFKVGDLVTAGGATGNVKEIGLFATTIETADNVLNIVGNNKIFSDNIQNFSATPFRRVDLQAPLHSTVNPVEAMKLVQPRIAQVQNVMRGPAPVVEILQLGRDGTMLALPPFCKIDNYWQVYFDTNRTVQEAFQQAGYSPPDLRIIQETRAM
jgi:small conductance mechanosensitive channel